jgi:hypothetical protein
MIKTNIGAIILLSLAGTLVGQMQVDDDDLVFEVIVPRAPNSDDATGFVTAVLHGRTLGYEQVLEWFEGVAVKAEGTVNEKGVLGFVTVSAGESRIPNPGIVLSSIEYVRFEGGGEYVLEYRVPKVNVVNTIWDGVLQDAQQNPLPQVMPGQASVKEAFTGLAIDLSGYDVKPNMIVSVLTTDDREVYGANKPTREYVSRYGMVGYGKSLELPAAIKERVGKTPMVVKATGYTGGNAVVSDFDAERIVAAAAAQGFLAQALVVFLLGN